MGTLKRTWLIFGASALLLGILFHCFPEMDIYVSALFFNEQTFVMDKESPWLWWSYRALPILGDALFVLIVLCWIASFFGSSFLKKRRVFFLFLICAALLGPILLTESIKTFSGRARPYNTALFNGEKPFTPAFSVANFCTRNCSFVSGHVSAASFIFGFLWFIPAAKRRKYNFYASFFVLAVAFSRMVCGAHFLSDCVFGLFTTLFALLLTETLFRYFRLLPR